MLLRWLVVGWFVLTAAAWGDGAPFSSPAHWQLDPSAPAQDWRLKTSVHLKFPNWVFEPNGSVPGEVFVRSARPVAVPGQPALVLEQYAEETLPPLPRYLLQLPSLPGMDLKVEFIPTEVRRIEGAPKLSRRPETASWAEPSIAEWPPAHSSGPFFPGRVVDARPREGNLEIRLSPFQWNPATGELFVVEGGELRLFFGLGFGRAVQDLVRSQSDSLILSRRSLKGAVEKLQAFHLKNHGIKSSVLYADDLDANSEMLPDSEYPNGYVQDATGGGLVRAYDSKTGAGYDFNLARRIAKKLQTWMKPTSGSKIKYLTILGDAHLIPPSYYAEVRLKVAGGWLATDACYGAYNHCTEPVFAVGRLPFSDEKSVESFLDKELRFLKMAPTAPSELVLFGGKPFDGHFFEGELGALRILSPLGASWRGAQKNFRSKENYTRETVVDTLSGKAKSMLMFSLDHGNGNEWAAEGWLIAGDSLEKAAAPLADGITPIVGSIGCSNAAFDIELIQLPSKVFNHDWSGPAAVGVSLLRSQSGAVAYLGSNRKALGLPQYELSADGSLEVTGSTHGVELLEKVFVGYHDRGEGRLGDFFKQSQVEFIANHGSGLTDDRSRWSYLNFSLLGDPTLPLPTRTVKEKSYPTAVSKTVFEPAIGNDPFPSIGLKLADSFTLKVESSVETLAELYRLIVQDPLVSTDEKRIASGTLSAGAVDFDFKFASRNPENVMFLRLENRKGVPVEKQVWFRRVVK